MALSNSEKQARHRYYRDKAISWYERQTGWKIKDIMDIMKLYEIERKKGLVISPNLDDN